MFVKMVRKALFRSLASGVKTITIGERDQAQPNSKFSKHRTDRQDPSKEV